MVTAKNTPFIACNRDELHSTKQMFTAYPLNTFDLIDRKLTVEGSSLGVTIDDFEVLFHGKKHNWEPNSYENDPICDSDRFQETLGMSLIAEIENEHIKRIEANKATRRAEAELAVLKENDEVEYKTT